MTGGVRRVVVDRTRGREIVDMVMRFKLTGVDVAS